MIVDSLLSTLKRLFCWFSCRSDSISATQCFILLQKVLSMWPQYFADAVSCFLLASSKFEDLVTIFRNNTVFLCHSDSEPFRELYSELDPVLQSVVNCTLLAAQIIDKPTDSRASALELETLSHISTELEEEIEDMSRSVNDETIESDMSLNIDMMIQKQLATLTMLMLYAKLCLDSGQPMSAVQCLCSCRAQCKKFVTFLRFASRHSGYPVGFDDIAIQVDDILTMCLERLAIAFCRCGIRRKAEDFALMAVMKQQSLTNYQSVSRIKMQDLIDLIERHKLEECFLHPIRSLMKIAALSSSADKLASQHVVIEEIEPSDQEACIYSILCKAKNVLTCKSLKSMRWCIYV